MTVDQFGAPVIAESVASWIPVGFVVYQSSPGKGISSFHKAKFSVHQAWLVVELGVQGVHGVPGMSFANTPLPVRYCNHKAVPIERAAVEIPYLRARFLLSLLNWINDLS